MTDIERLETKVDELSRIVTGLVGLLMGSPGSVVIGGRVTPPQDYGPAIAALSEHGRKRMQAYLDQGHPQDRAIALAADWENEQRVA